MRITSDQYGLLHRFLGSPMRRLLNLRRRLERAGAVPGEPYYDQVCRCVGELHKLTVETHYRSCSSGVARGPEHARNR